LSREERLSVSRGFETLPRDLQTIIASINAGTLMNLARTSLLFADIGNQEWVWKQMFQRDFPKEFVFCRGRAFFFNIRGSRDKLNWKGFYLNVAKEYFDISKKFISYHINNNSFIGTNVPQINLAWANSTQIRDWVRTVMLKNHYSFHDWRASLSWMFVCAVVWCIKDDNERFNIEDINTIALKRKNNGC
jgi:hypothetical protein